MDNSSFENDLRIEHEIAKYLDANLYRTSLFSECNRTHTDYDQKRGCDIILSSEIFDLHSAIVDEKATIHYLNQDIATFAFEISYKSPKNGDRVQGWFLDDRKETQAYLLIWPFVKQKEVQGRFDNMTYEDISGIRFLIVNRGKIRAYLAKRGFTKQRLLNKAAEIAKNGIDGKIVINKDDEREDYPFYFYSSLKYPEKPVNLVIERYVLWCLADKKGGIIGNPAQSRIRGW